MTEDEAFMVMTPLCIACNGFTDPKVAWWVQRLQELRNPDAALRVANRIADTHTDPGAPAWATFLNAYRGEVRDTTPALPPAPTKRQGFAHYVELLRDRAETGDTEANRQIATLDRIASRIRGGDTPAWIEALAPEVAEPINRGVS